MNTLFKYLSLLTIFTINCISLAYNFGFTNLTNKIVVVEMSLLGTYDEFYNIVGPGQKTNFDWGWPNARAGFCLDKVRLGIFDEAKAKVNFPDTNSPKLPRTSDNMLDIAKITKAIDARGPWFKSLTKWPENTDMAFINNDRWNNLTKKLNTATELLKKGVDAQQALAQAGIDQELQVTTDKPKDIGRCMSLDFVIVDHFQSGTHTPKPTLRVITKE